MTCVDPGASTAGVIGGHAMNFVQAHNLMNLEDAAARREIEPEVLRMYDDNDTQPMMPRACVQYASLLWFKYWTGVE